jgi:hypothetical protein
MPPFRIAKISKRYGEVVSAGYAGGLSGFGISELSWFAFPSGSIFLLSAKRSFSRVL